MDDLRFPFFPFYVMDYLTSVRVLAMTNEQRGGYVTLLALCWRSGECALPDQLTTLQTLSGLSAEAIVDVRAMFVKHPSRARCLTNERLYGEWQKAVALSLVKSEAGAKGNAIRWGSQRDTSASRTPIAVGSQSDDYASRKRIAKRRHSQSQSQSEKKKKKETRTTMSMPEGWKLSDGMLEYATRKGMTVPTATHEFEHCKTHHVESVWTEIGWASKVWHTWVLNWVSFGKKQVPGSGNGSQLPKSFQLLKTSDVVGEDPPEEVQQILRKAGKGMSMPKGNA